MSSRAITIDGALSDPALLGAALGDQSTWLTWRSVLKAAHGRPLTKRERAAFDVVAGGREPPRAKVKELIVVASRRCGKGRMAGAMCVYEAVLKQHELAPGETGVIACISPTRAQAQIVQDYAHGFLTASPILRGEVADVTAEEIRLRNGNIIATLAADHRGLRGRTLLLAILDEAAFLRRDDAASSDLETARALLPGLSTTSGMLMVLSSPYARRGLVFERHKDHFGRDDADVLVVAGPSSAFNPVLDQAVIDAACANDPEAARSEWLGEFRSDVAALLDPELIDAAVDRDRPLELPPGRGVRYFAHVDAAAGGGGGAAYAIALAHKEAGGCLVVDLVQGAAGRFDPQAITRGYAGLLREYGVNNVVGDRFAPGWVEAAWREHGIAYRQSEPNRSEIYLAMVPAFSRGLVRLPDHPRLLRELRLLERRVARNGRETVTHPHGATDDLVNAACGALRSASTAAPALWAQADLVGDGPPAPVPTQAEAVYASLVGGPRGVAVVFFARSRVGRTPIVTVLDYALSPLSPASLRGVVERLLDLSKQCGGAPAFAFATSAIAAEIERLGQVAHVIDRLLKDETLPVAAAAHIGGHRIKLSVQARERSAVLPLGLLDGAASDDEDEVRLAALAGIAIGLDENRAL
jgi:hypothetical protein